MNEYLKVSIFLSTDFDYSAHHWMYHPWVGSWQQSHETQQNQIWSLFWFPVLRLNFLQIHYRNRALCEATERALRTNNGFLPLTELLRDGTISLWLRAFIALEPWGFQVECGANGNAALESCTRPELLALKLHRVLPFEANKRKMKNDTWRICLDTCAPSFTFFFFRVAQWH